MVEEWPVPVAGIPMLIVEFIIYSQVIVTVYVLGLCMCSKHPYLPTSLLPGSVTSVFDPAGR